MEPLTSPENATKLCDHIFNVLEKQDHSKDELSTYLKGLKYVCCGKIGERAGILSLSSEEKLAGLLQITDFDFSITEQNDFMHSAFALLSCSRLTFETCNSLKIILSCPSKFNKSNQKLMIEKLFNHKDFSAATVELIEEVIKLDTTQLELHIINLYSEQLKSNSILQVWNTHNSKHWIAWCSKSTKLFCKTCSIMNQLLLTVKNTTTFLKVISSFINNILTFCDKNGLDFIRLYPIKLQPLLSLMSLNTEGLPSQYCYNLCKRIYEEINILRKDHPDEALMLWTHFIKWEKWLNFEST